MNYEQKLIEIAKRKENFLILTAENRAAIRNLPEILPDRFIDFGIMEQTMVGAAAGLSLRGNVCVAHALAAFLTMRAFEFIRTDIGISKANVKLVGSFAGIFSEANGPTHQAIEDIAIMRGIPNLKVFAPADEHDLVDALETIINDPMPWYIRYNNLRPLYKRNEKFKIGKAEIVFDGNDVAILTYGALFNECYKASNILSQNGISVFLANLRTLKPIDIELIKYVVNNFKVIVLVEDHFKIGGLYSIIAEILLENKLNANIIPINFGEKWFKPSLLVDALKYEGMDAASISEAIMKAMSYKKINNKIKELLNV